MAITAQATASSRPIFLSSAVSLSSGNVLEGPKEEMSSLRSLLLLLTLCFWFQLATKFNNLRLGAHLPHLSLHLLSFFLPLSLHFPKVYWDHSAHVFINVRREHRLEETELFCFSSLLTLQKPLLYKLGFWDWKGRRKGSLQKMVLLQINVLIADLKHGSVLYSFIW